jgi:TonB family protein
VNTVITVSKLSSSVARRSAYRIGRAEHRSRGRQRIAARVVVAPGEAQRRHDPLCHRQKGRITRWSNRALWLAGSLIAHLTILASGTLAGAYLTRQPVSQSEARQSVEVSVIERPPPELSPKPETRSERAVVKQPTPRRRRPAAPPPEPLAPKPAPTHQRPRRIVGLSLGSTVTGGGGPAFAVGNTRMGETDRVADDPELASRTAVPRQRIASRIPTASVKFTPPEKLVRIAPEYPPELKAQGIEADVVLVVTIAVDGTVARATVVKGASHPDFDRATLAAAQKERYRPARRDGVPVAHTIKLTARFRLTDY